MKFTKKTIEAIEPAAARQTYFDDTITGLAVKVMPTGRKSFYYCYRAGKGRGAPKRQIQIGTFPDMTVELSRIKARHLQAQVINGRDPAVDLHEAKQVKSLSEIMELFFTEHVRPKLKPKSIDLYEGAARKHILPVMGKMKVEAVTHRDVARIHHALAETPYMGNRVAAILSKFFNWCEVNGYRGRGSNPVAGLEKYKEEKRMDFLGTDDLTSIGLALADLEAGDRIQPLAAAALRLLLLTGARLREVLSLKWTYVDLDEGLARLPDSKTGFKVLHLSAPALEVLSSLPAMAFSEYVFPSLTAAIGHMEGLQKPWAVVCEAAKLQGRWRVHDLRHGFASAAVNSGASLPMIGALLGHSQASTTARYAHVAKNPVHELAESTAGRIADALKAAPREKSYRSSAGRLAGHDGTGQVDRD